VPRDEPTASPDGGRTAAAWGSDAIAELLSRLDLPYISLTPGSSFRGLHDSLVNHLGNRRPRMIVCLHEEHAAAIAHGYAKVSGRPMAVALHSNVGLFHASMAIFNAYCDRVPMLVLGATGPLDAARRRPWIDWIHTAADQGAVVRDYVKWDDQPGSVSAALEAIVRADAVTRAYPSAPVYVCLDAALQEAPLPPGVVAPSPERHRPPAPLPPDPATAERVVELLLGAERPLVLAGRVGRDLGAWEARLRLAEQLGACVLTDLKTAGAFPTAHPLHPAPPGVFPTAEALALLGRADVVLSLDWVDLGGTLRQASGGAEPPARIISVSGDGALHRGWSKDHFGLAPADVAIASHPDAVVPALLERLGGRTRPRGDWPPPRPAPPPRPPAGGAGTGVGIGELAAALRQALDGRPSCLARVPLGWHGEDWTVSHPLDYVGLEGGAGVGAGPGLAVGAALALEGEDRLAVAVMGDGDYLMGATALWTAAHCRLPLLVVVANNRSFFNDEVHQQRVALSRGRPVENRWVGQRLDDPAPDVAGMARSLGLEGHGPVTDRSDLLAVLRRAAGAAWAGASVVVDVAVDTADYPGLAAPAAGAGTNRDQR
jgi:thiamine pyrophosphate-dependent acetolactate synthase large subunit-like protein